MRTQKCTVWLEESLASLRMKLTTQVNDFRRKELHVAERVKFSLFGKKNLPYF